MDTDPLLTTTKRKMRSQWVQEEQDLMAESAIYAKRRISYLDYVTNIANSGNEVKVSSFADGMVGTIYKVGSDYFTLRLNNNKTKTIYPVANKSTETFSPVIEVMEVKEIKKAGKISDAGKESFFGKAENTFRSELEELCTDQIFCSVTTSFDVEFQGHISLLSNAIELRKEKDDLTKWKLVKIGTKIVPMTSVVSVSFEDDF